MKQRPPVNSIERKKRVGAKIKSIRKQLKLTQPEFGLLVNDNKPIDKKTVYEWEKGIHLPKLERLSEIANLGNITIQELVYGDSKEYIYGIILYRDSVIQEELNFSDIDLAQHLNTKFPPPRPDYTDWLNRYFKLDLISQENIARNTFDFIKSNDISISNITEIKKAFIQSIVQEFNDDILLLTNKIEENLDVMLSEWLPSQLEDTAYPKEALDEIFESISGFRQSISTIGQKYKKNKGGVTE
ncbi:helix-turn-helix transcriptional regulator [Enterococcus sp. BWB1-3]|uniref:helix-turn-helix transcriptional regulator n=1 Tax=Enterococcus sp. BWB1-3 TaxID=2787713 RepID=UPI0019237A31|nr:helix-turn-helix transcriptional regulator [Enterococcus sp. BWB1-3]MBL1229339.1 helix-turn-helix transcriptional regulator [Enterococcus sp. BWB1-3]